jgi:hypothetical protein
VGSSCPETNTDAEACAEKISRCVLSPSVSNRVAGSVNFALHQMVRLMIRWSQRALLRLGELAQGMNGQAFGAQFR